MTFPCEIEWVWPGDSRVIETQIARTSGELRDQLANIRAAANEKQIAISVCVVTPKKNVFSMVLGLPYGSILTYDGGPEGDPPYFVSLGDDEKDGSFVHYFFGGEISELPARFVISEELALNALIDSLEKEQPSPLIEWYGG